MGKMLSEKVKNTPKEDENKVEKGITVSVVVSVLDDRRQHRAPSLEGGRQPLSGVARARAEKHWLFHL